MDGIDITILLKLTEGMKQLGVESFNFESLAVKFAKTEPVFEPLLDKEYKDVYE